MTLDDAGHALKRGLVGELLSVAGLLQAYAAKHWRNVLEDPTVIRLTKVDFCRDYMGSFIPARASEAYQQIKERLREVFDVVAADSSLNVLPNTSGMGFIVRAGDNRLRTSFQYVVADHQSNKLATVKVYDKTLDLMGREGCKTVGSRFPVILGSKRARGDMERRAWKAQSTGMTRVELSLHVDGHNGCHWDPEDMVHAWHEKMPRVLDVIADGVLNHETVLGGCFKKLSMHALLSQFGQVAPNFLVIGTERSWLVNCSTSHANFFVGTESRVCLRKNVHSKQMWARIEQLVKRYAFPGAKVFVYYLGRHRFNDCAVAVTRKPSDAPY